MIENIDFLKQVLSVPTHTYEEDMMIDFLANYLSERQHQFYVDDYGNVYVTKGEISDGEFYPCVVSHTDTVHTLDTINVKEEYLPNSKGNNSNEKI